jgi:AcrR family transcriptional regulator
MPKTDKRTKIVDAFMQLLAEHGWANVSLGMIAGRAGVPLSELRAEFDGKGAILAAFAREIDRRVLDGIDAQLADEPARERLFDTLMRRFDALVPYKDAIRALDQAVRQDPMLGLELFQIALTSQTWMLTAAEIDTGGTRGAIAARGLVLAYGRVVRVWLDDEDPGMARTMSALDRELRRAEGNMRRLDDLARLAAPFQAIARRMAAGRRSRRDRPRDTVDTTETSSPTTH